MDGYYLVRHDCLLDLVSGSLVDLRQIEMNEMTKRSLNVTLTCDTDFKLLIST